ncbi:class I SAM-dependent methyltransferase [Nonomuraea sp. NPDC050227]|uniref:class I SAM-dependent methyltransferase n=1 Tax=Nonomuraea sp. NPDC050227 TaxID=3364360 RepID=UPI0037B9DF80
MKPTKYFELFLDSQLNHSSGYFSSDDVSLESAQVAKIDEILAKCQLEPDMRLLDVGCGWGAAVRAAATKYQVRATGITIEIEQYSYASRREKEQSTVPCVDFRLQRWEEFTESVDRIICINAFESFSDKRLFFSHCRGLLPRDGIMVMLSVTAERRIFRVMPKGEIIDLATAAGFDVEVSDSLAAHYIRTLEHFVLRLNSNRDELTRLIGEADLARAIEYYSKSARFLESGMNDMFEFAFTAR